MSDRVWLSAHRCEIDKDTNAIVGVPVSAHTRMYRNGELERYSDAELAELIWALIVRTGFNTEGDSTGGKRP